MTVFPDEMTAFAAYAQAMPHNCALLVDTYDTLQGVKHAIAIGKQLKEQGAELRAVRLDSGDTAKLSIAARKLLDEAGFTRTKIIASNNLDEHVITELKNQGAQISIWGVGTRLVTGYDHPALDGVYKLSAIRDAAGKWIYKLKLSEEAVKTSNPGIQQIRRYFKNNQPVMDVIYDQELNIVSPADVVSANESHESLSLQEFDASTDLLQPIFRKGRLVYQIESIHALRERALQQTTEFMRTGGRDFYPVGLDSRLYQLKKELLAAVSKISNFARDGSED